jgi:hypothetical protein
MTCGRINQKRSKRRDKKENWEALSKKHKQVSLPVQHKQVFHFALSGMGGGMSNTFSM